MAKQRHTNIVAAFLVLYRDDRVLLLKRKNTGYQDGNYGVVSGHLEPGESFSAAIIREAKEEAGITISSHDLSRAHVMHRKSEEDDSERVDIYFLCESWDGTISNKEPDKCDDLSWFDLTNLPKNIIPCVHDAIIFLLNDRAYSEWGWEG